MKRLLSLVLIVVTGWLGLGAQEIRLSNRFIMDVAVDAQDRVWLATEEGLTCYDGIGTRVFLKQTGGLPGSQLNRVLVDRDDPLLWVATQKAGLARYDMETDQFTVYRAGDTADSLPDDDISDVEQAPDGSIWLASFSKGLCRLDKETGQFERYNPDTFPGMRDVPLHIFKFRDDQLVLGYWAGGVSIQSLTDRSRTDLRAGTDSRSSLPSDEVRSLLVDSRNRIWIGTLNGLVLYTGAGRELLWFQHRDGDSGSLPDNAVFDLVEDDSGHLLVGTGGGVASVDIRGEIRDARALRFVPMNRFGRRDRDEVRTMALDRFGNLWIGTYGAGLLFLAGRESGAGCLQTLPSGVGPREVQELHVGTDGRLVIGLHTGQVEVYPSGSAHPLPDYGEGDPVLSLLMDQEGRWWTGSSLHGLFLSARGRFQHVPLEGNPQSVRALLEDGPSLWIGSDQGLYKIRRDNLRTELRLSRREGLPDNLVRSLLKDAAGRLWVGTFGHGVVVYGPDMTKLAQYDSGSGLPSDIVNDLLQASDGTVWVATAAGLVRIDLWASGQNRMYVQSDTPVWVIEEGNCRSLIEDNAGNLWVCMNDVVLCLLTDGRTVTFDSRDGLPDGNYFSAAAAITPDGRLWFGNTDGLAWVDPHLLLIGSKLPPVKFLSQPADLSTDYRNNYLHVRFCVPDHALAGRAEYEYRLPGISDAWHACGPELDFYSLPVGRHKLDVRARIHTQDWGPDEEISSTELYIRPPFWKTWLARGLYILLALAFVAAAALYQTRRAKRKNQETLQRDMLLKERQVIEERSVFFTNVTHELRTPLTLILGPLEDLSEDTTIPAGTRNRIEKVRQSARQLLGLVNRLLEFRKTETDNRRLTVREGDLSRFVEEIGERFRDLSRNKAVSFALSVEPDIRLLYDQEAIEIILNNLLSNAQKYTPSGMISLSMQRREDGVAISVSDTGCGISQADQQHIFDRFFQVKGPHQASGTGIGLALVKNLCDLHHIALSVRSELGKGSEFSLLLDPEEDYPEAQHIESDLPSGPVPEETIPEETGRTSILVVEDNPEILEYIRDSLTPEYAVLLASQGREGLKIAIRDIPDIIVSDIMMPGMNGIDMCKAIRQDVRTSHIPVILLTAKGTDEDRMEGYDVGADSYLVKPFRKSLLTSRIRNLLERRKRMMTQVSESGTAPELSQVDNEFLTRYSRFVEEHLSDERIDVNSLAGEFAMSQSTLYRKVKAVSGLSPVELVRNIRLTRAAELLERSTLSISEISWQTGFGSPVYFRDCFKERYGQTPSEYRTAKKGA